MQHTGEWPMTVERVMEVPASAAAVWRRLTEPGALCDCSDGTATSVSSRRCERLTTELRISGARYTLRGHVRVVTADRARQHAVLRFEGSDRLGNNHADARIEARLTDLGGRTRVDVTAQQRVVGRLGLANNAELAAAADRVLAEAEQVLAASVRSAPSAETSAAAPTAAGARTRPRAALTGVGGALVLALLWAVVGRGHRARRREARVRSRAQLAELLRTDPAALRARALGARRGRTATS